MSAISVERLRAVVVELTSAVEALAPKFPGPVPVLAGGQAALRHLPEHQDDLMLSYLKCVRSASALNAALVLLEHGYTFEVGTLCRGVDESTDDVFFMAMPRGSDGSASNDQRRHLEEFYEEEFDRMANPMAAAPGRDRVSRPRIHAAIGRTPDFPTNPNDWQALAQTLSRAFSGFVHGSYVHIMELFGGNPARFHLRGMLNTPRIPAAAHMLASTTYRALMAVVIVARRCGTEELGEHIKRVGDTLAEAGDLVVKESDAAALYARLKRGRPT